MVISQYNNVNPSSNLVLCNLIKADIAMKTMRLFMWILNVIFITVLSAKQCTRGRRLRYYSNFHGLVKKLQLEFKSDF